MAKQAVLVKDLVKKYKKAEKAAVDGVSFSVAEGAFFSLLGPNGAGKTTIISILTTTLAKTSGTVTIAGYDVDKEQAKVRAHIGVIFQKPSLDLNLTAEENIRFHAVLYGMYPFRPLFSFMSEPYKKKVYVLADLLGITQDLFRPMKTFSGGMKRKLEIIRSLMHSPKILFLDEPTSGLDPLSRKNLWEYLQEVKQKQKTTIFLTTHYLEEAEDADHLVIMNKGKNIASGTPETIKKKLTEEFLLVGSTADLPGLRKELRSNKFEFSENGLIKIQLGKKSVQEVIHAIKTPLSVIKTHTPTLEEAYLEIIQDYERA